MVADHHGHASGELFSHININHFERL